MAQKQTAKHCDCDSSLHNHVANACPNEPVAGRTLCQPCIDKNLKIARSQPLPGEIKPKPKSSQEA
jgi:hypothetical protein